MRPLGGLFPEVGRFAPEEEPEPDTPAGGLAEVGVGFTTLTAGVDAVPAGKPAVLPRLLSLLPPPPLAGR